MASISLHIDGEIRVEHSGVDGDCMSVNLHSEMEAAGERFTYSKDWITLHGSIADMRRFAEKMLKVLPLAAEAEAEKAEAA